MSPPRVPGLSPTMRPPSLEGDEAILDHRASAARWAMSRLRLEGVLRSRNSSTCLFAETR